MKKLLFVIFGLFLIILGIIFVFGYIVLNWHNNELEKAKNETLQKQVEELKMESEEVLEERKDLEVKNVEVKEVKEVENFLKDKIIEEEDEDIKNLIDDTKYDRNLKEDFYCERNNDCVIKNIPTCRCIDPLPVCVNNNSSLNMIKIDCKPSTNCIIKIKIATGCNCVSNRCKTFYK